MACGPDENYSKENWGASAIPREITLNLNVKIEIINRDPSTAEVLRLLELLIKRLESVMAKVDTIAQLQQAINDATNKTATEIQALIDKINATPGDGLDGPQTDAVINWLTALKAQQESMAATAADPTPVPAPPAPTL